MGFNSGFKGLRANFCCRQESESCCAIHSHAGSNDVAYASVLGVFQPKINKELINNKPHLINASMFVT